MSEQNVMEGSPDFAGESFSGDFGDDQFNSETESDSASDGQPGPGMGQSKSSRRRRRKRKKTSTPGEATAGSAPAGEASTPVPIVMEGERLALAASAGAPTPRRSSNGYGGGQNGGQQQGQGQGPGKRWKKKFRDRDRRPAPSSPGNDFRPESTPAGFNGNDRSFSSDRAFSGDRVFNNNGGGGDRSYDRPYRPQGGGRPDNFGNLVSHQGRKAKGGPGKDRSFVGPMDHSYREMNTEFGEAPPSTIQLRGRHGRRHFGDSQPIDHNAPRPVPIPEGAQTHIYMFVEDLFIIAKVQETAKKLGVKVAFIKNEKEAIAELTSGEDQNKPALIVFDLNNANAKPLTLIPKLKSKLKRATSIIGFLSMIQGDLKAKAVEAGCDTVMPRAAFSQNLPNLLRRYGVEEAEEINFNY